MSSACCRKAMPGAAKLHVHNHDSNRAGSQMTQRFRNGTGGKNGMPRGLEHLGQQQADGGLVIDDQDGPRRQFLF